MKKLSVLIAMLLVVTLAVPTLGATFSDVPSNHWAYDAVNKLVAAGIIEGYPDGTYKGQRNLSRYEIAMVISRVLDKVEAERQAMQAELDALQNEDEDKGLSSEQAKDVTAIVKAMMEKNMPKEEEKDTKVAAPSGLTDKEAEQVANLIEALTFEFKAELKVLGADLDALGSDVDALADRVEALENAEPKVAFSGEFGVDYEEIVVDEPVTGEAYLDPYTEDKDDDDDVDSDDWYEDTDTFEQTLDMNIAINKGSLSADLTLSGHSDAFDNSYTDDTPFFELDDVTGTISGENFVATVGEDQLLTLKPYLFEGTVDEDDDDGDDDDEDPLFPVNGVIVEAFDETYVLSKTNADNYATDGNTIMAGTETLSVAGMDLNFGYGVENGLASGNGVLGVDTTLEASGFSITPTFAFSDKELDETYFTLNAEGDLGPVATTFNYENIEGFEAIAADIADSNGFDVEGTMSVDVVDLTAYFEDYGEPFTELKAEVTEENAKDVAGLAVYGDTTFATYSDLSDATAKEFNVYADKEMGALTLGGALEYADITADFDTEYGDTDVYEESDYFDKILTADYTVSEAVSVGAELTLDKDNDLAHLYTADYEQGMITAGAEKYLDDPDENDNTYLTASVAPDAYEVMAVSLTPYADFGYKMDSAADDTFVNYAFGVDAAKDLSAKATMTGKVEYADKEFDVDNSGTKVTKELGFEYAITEDVSATADFMDLDFEGDDADASYDVKKATAGVSVAF